MNIRSVIDNHPAVIFLAAAVGAFGAGWFAYKAVQDAAGLVPISQAEFRELERRASLGKEELIRENLGLKEKEAYYENTIGKLQEAIRINRQPAMVKVTNVALSPPSPATLQVGDEVIVEYDYDIATADSVELGAGIGGFGPRLTLKGRGRAKQRIQITKNLLLGFPKTSHNSTVIESIFFAYLEPVSSPVIIDGRIVPSGGEIRMALVVPVLYKVKY